MLRNTNIWNGEKDVAQVVNQAGQWSSGHSVSKMFDSNPKTCWHSGRQNTNNLKIIGVHFHVSSQFCYLKCNLSKFLQKCFLGAS